jgi:hypothetical protein
LDMENIIPLVYAMVSVLLTRSWIATKFIMPILILERLRLSHQERNLMT